MHGEHTTLFLGAGAPPAGAPADTTTHSRAMKDRVQGGFSGANPTGDMLHEHDVSVTEYIWDTGSIMAGGGDSLGFLAAFASMPLAKQRLDDGRWTISVFTAKDAVFGAAMANSLYIWNPTTGTVRDYLWDSPMSLSTEFSINGNYQTYSLPGRGVDVEDGDLLVIEFWVRYFGGINPLAAGCHMHFGGRDDRGTLIAPQRLLFQGEALPVFSFDVDWATPLRTLEAYSTSIMAGRGGTEQRMALRNAPNLTLAYRCVAIEAREAELLDALLASNRTMYRIPWWPGMELLDAVVAIGQTVIPMPSTVAHRFVAGEEAIFWQSPFVYETVTVLSVEADSVTLSAGPVAAWDVATIFMPLKQGWLLKGVDVDRANRETGSTDVELRIQTAAA